MNTIQFKSKSQAEQPVSDMDGVEGARRATGAPSMSSDLTKPKSLPPDPEVPEKKPRRRFTAAYKLRILKEYATSRDHHRGSKKNLGDPGDISRQQRRSEMMATVTSLGESVGKKAACNALAVPRATFYRHHTSQGVDRDGQRPAPPLALSVAEKQTVLDIAHEKRFWDLSPYQIYATLLDDGQYLCSISTYYRILAQHNEVKERRKQVCRPHYQKPELLATKPNQVWSWDITKLKGPAKWTYFHLYVILDIFSRYVVGWMVAHRESAALAKRLIQETCEKQRIPQGQLTLHADRGSSMKSKAVAHLLADLGITKTHNRPYVSNDNPYSESQFKTLKGCQRILSQFLHLVQYGS